VAADAMQHAVALLTAGLDAQLAGWAATALVPEDPVALGDLLAGLHIVGQLLLHELAEATGQPPRTTLQRLAVLAEACRLAGGAG